MQTHEKPAVGTLFLRSDGSGGTMHDVVHRALIGREQCGRVQFTVIAKTGDMRWIEQLADGEWVDGADLNMGRL